MYWLNMPFFYIYVDKMQPSTGCTSTTTQKLMNDLFLFVVSPDLKKA